MTRLALVLAASLTLVLASCGAGAGPELLPPYDGPLETGQTEWTGYQPGTVDINDLVGGPGGIPGVIPGVHTYQVVLAQGIDWNSADALAKQAMKNGVAGHLATVTSPEENAAVEALRAAVTTGEVWIGGFQPAGSPEPGGGWTWVNGEGPIPGTNGGPGYSNWAAGEPNNAQGVEQHLTIGLHGPGLWNDEGILPVNGYVIEWDY